MGSLALDSKCKRHKYKWGVHLKPQFVDNAETLVDPLFIWKSRCDVAIMKANALAMLGAWFEQVLFAVKFMLMLVHQCDL